MKLLSEISVSSELQYSIENGYPLGALFRIGSKKFFDLMREVYSLHKQGHLELSPEEEVINSLKIGTPAECNGVKVALNLPLTDTHQIGYDEDGPDSDWRKFQVFVEVEGEVRKIEFFDKVGITLYNNDEKQIELQKQVDDNFIDDPSTEQYWQSIVGLMRSWYRPRRRGSETIKPYIDEDVHLEGEELVIKRTFPGELNVELSWHTDGYDRTFEVLEGGGWFYQSDNQMPVEMVEGMHIFVAGDEIHRGIMGPGDLVIYIRDDTRIYKEQK